MVFDIFAIYLILGSMTEDLAKYQHILSMLRAVFYEGAEENKQIYIKASSLKECLAQMSTVDIMILGHALNNIKEKILSSTAATESTTFLYTALVGAVFESGVEVF